MTVVGAEAEYAETGHMANAGVEAAASEATMSAEAEDGAVTGDELEGVLGAEAEAVVAGVRASAEADAEAELGHSLFF